MLYSTYFGGGNPSARSDAITIGGSVAVDSSGYMYFTGTTNMQNFIGDGMPAPFPILNATQPCLDQPGVTTCTLLTNPANTDGILVKLNPSQSEPGIAPFYSTYLGGTGNDTGNAVAVDSSDNAYVTGSTNSSDWSCTGFCIFGPNPPFGDNDTNWNERLHRPNHQSICRQHGISAGLFRMDWWFLRGRRLHGWQCHCRRFGWNGPCCGQHDIAQPAH